MSFLTDKTESQCMLLSEKALQDLLLDDYMNGLFAPYLQGKTFEWTKYLTLSEENILYRREVLKALMRHHDLIGKMSALTETIGMITRLKDMRDGSEYGAEAFREFGVMQEAHRRMREMQEALLLLKQTGDLPEGLKRLYDVISEKLEKHFHPGFAAEWEKLSTGMERPGSFEVRFALDEELHTTGASIVRMSKDKYVRSHLFGTREGQMPDKIPELAPLKEMVTPAEELLLTELRYNQRSLWQVLSRMTLDLDELYQDLIFYLGALDYCSEMAKKGVPMTYAHILPKEKKGFRAQKMIHPMLARFHGSTMVANDVSFSDGGEIFLLTGINQGGKTTFLRTVGALQLLFQLGLPVPAKEAAISPVDKIVPVFSHEENTELENGKLGQELNTVQDGMREGTVYSLMLFNEPITGTSPMENLYLSRLVLSACKVKGYKGIWVTHLYDLASRADAMNEKVSGSKISSLVAKAVLHGDTADATYVIVPGEPAFNSYAREVMKKEVPEGVFG